MLMFISKNLDKSFHDSGKYSLLVINNSSHQLFLSINLICMKK